MQESSAASDSTSADEPAGKHDPLGVAGAPANQWGFWEDVVLFGVAFLGTVYFLWMLPYYFVVLDVIAGLLVGIVALGTRRLGYLDGITSDGGTRFFQASALVVLTPYAIAVPAAELGFGDVLAIPVVKLGCVLGGVLAGTVWYRR